MTAKKKTTKKIAKAKQLVSDVLPDKAADLNPLTPRAPEPVVPEEVPRITNESIAEHREEVLSGARKFIYPLAHSKHRIIVITTGIIIGTLIAFLVYCGLALYKFHQYNSFVYRVTQVVPFPIARENGHFVDYENYLYELRHYVHYYESQLQRDFAGTDKQQLELFRRQALQDTINNAYVKDLAKQNGVKVSDGEVNARIQQVRDQNRLGASNKVFADVLRDYWGWSVSDFKRSLKQQILAEKVAAKLDTTASQKADVVLAKVKAGNDFSKVAKTYSEDKDSAKNGGDYGFRISHSNANVPPQVTDVLFGLKAGKTSGIILASPVLSNNNPTLEIVKVIKNDGTNVTAKHITINLKDIAGYIEDQAKKHPSKNYIHF